MAKNRERSGKIDSPYESSDKLHIIFMRRFGRTRTARVSPRYLVIFAIFVIAYLVLSLFLINNYSKLSHENELLKNRNDKLAQKVKEYRVKGEFASQYRDLVEELKRAENDIDSTVEEEAKTPAPAQSEDQALVEKVETVEADGSDQAKENPPLVKKDDPIHVSGLVLEPRPESNSIQFSFNLRKVDTKLDMVSGYMIIVLENRKLFPPVAAPFPASVKLSNGEPVNYRRGQQFKIRFGKIIKASLSEIQNPTQYNAATVYAYSSSGDLIMKDTIFVNNSGNGN